jgi:hypothetical protein
LLPNRYLNILDRRGYEGIDLVTSKTSNYKGDEMQKEEMISLSAMQHVALIGLYRNLAWDLRFGTRNTQSLKSINKVLRQNFKNKSEAFDFIHRLFKRNNVPTLDLCDMGDCPEIKSKKIAGRSIGKFLLSWNTPEGITTNVVGLCNICKEDMKQANAIIEEMD